MKIVVWLNVNRSNDAFDHRIQRQASCIYDGNVTKALIRINGEQCVLLLLHVLLVLRTPSPDLTRVQIVRAARQQDHLPLYKVLCHPRLARTGNIKDSFRFLTILIW